MPGKNQILMPWEKKKKIWVADYLESNLDNILCN